MSYPYRCNRYKNGKRICRRANLKHLVPDHSEKCPHCGEYSLVLDKYRMKGRKDPVIGAKDCGGERCNCHGDKSRKEDKIQYIDGVYPVALGPHRKGQLGCMHYKGKIVGIDDVDEDIPFDVAGDVGTECPF